MGAHFNYTWKKCDRCKRDMKGKAPLCQSCKDVIRETKRRHRVK